METSFNMIIYGMTNYGKTYHLLKMIEKHYKKQFDYIVLICPTFTWNQTYQEWIYRAYQKKVNNFEMSRKL